MLYVGNDGAVINLLQSVLGPQFAGSAPPYGVTDPAVEQAADPDAEVQAYLALMDELAVALRQVVASEAQQGSINQVLDIADRLEEYMVFFAALDEEHLSQLLTTYSEQISETSDLTSRLAVAATEATDATGADSIALALQRTPAFAIEWGAGSSEPPAVNLSGTSVTPPAVMGMIAPDLRLTFEGVEYTGVEVLSATSPTGPVMCCGTPINMDDMEVVGTGTNHTSDGKAGVQVYRPKAGSDDPRVHLPPGPNRPSVRGARWDRHGVGDLDPLDG